MKAEQIVAVIKKKGWPYLTAAGEMALGCPVSGLPDFLRDAGYSNIGRDYRDEYALKDHGLTVVKARYVGGRSKRFCDVVIV